MRKGRNLGLVFRAFVTTAIPSALIGAALVVTGCAKPQEAGSGTPDGNGNAPDAGFRRDATVVDAVVLPDSITMTCGNGVMDSGESCDDGNTANRDGCNRVCQIEANYVCATPGQACVFQAKCGDQTVSSNEGCDDGNTANGDGCTSDCKVEPGWQCRVPGRRCVPLCGNGMLTATEECDDGNTMNGDGCSALCLLEFGATCPAPGQPCKIAQCGNGMVETGEACDAGPLNGLFLGDGSGCSRTCTKEPKCRDGAMTRACDISCGNGNVEMGEECDDGNAASGDGCSADCKTESGFDCAAQMRPDTAPCASGAGECLKIPVVYRDFKSEKETGGHPDFFYLGAPITPAMTITNPSGSTHATVNWNKRYCVPNSGGPAKQNDSAARCWDLATPTLNAMGKPAFNAARTGGNLCACQFTDWSHDTNGGHVPGYTNAANGPLNGLTYVSGPVGHPLYRGLAPAVKDAASFAQWFTDTPMSTKSVGTLDLAPTANNFYQFSSQPHAVYAGFFPIDPPMHGFPVGGQGMMGPGMATTVPGTMEPLLCNLWPYWYSSTQFGNGAGCKGDQYLFPPSADPVMYPMGMWGVQMQGWRHNFWYTTEARYLFVFTGAFELQFYGDDDLFIYINGQLVLDLGGVHQRLPGRVQVAATGMASIIEGGSVDPNNVIVPCPGIDPYTMQTTNMTCPNGTCDCRTRTVNLGLQMGRTYEIAVFHADRHPTESNYQLTLSGFATNRTSCTDRCGNGVVKGAEECDDGAMNSDTTYGGCTTQCKFGPYCGDGMMNGMEECDLGSEKNNTTYGDREGCSPGCKLPHYCGDAIPDTADGEECDLGPANGTDNSVCNKDCKIVIG